jgi:hypothetical protein
MALHTAREYGIDPSVVTRAEQLGTAFDTLCRPSMKLLESTETPFKALAGSTESISTTEMSRSDKPKGVKKHVSSSIVVEEYIEQQRVTVDTDETVVTVSSLEESAPIPAVQCDLTEVYQVMRSAVSEGPAAECVVVEANAWAPLAFEGKSCLYALLIQRVYTRTEY